MALYHYEFFFRPRETNKFQIQVNVAAKEKVKFELTYRELLRRKNGLYDHVIYVNPGQVVDDLKINVLIRESRKITTIRTPPIKDVLLTEGPQGKYICKTNTLPMLMHLMRISTT
jgi:hypothetical protein